MRNPSPKSNNFLTISEKEKKKLLLKPKSPKQMKRTTRTSRRAAISDYEEEEEEMIPISPKELKPRLKAKPKKKLKRDDDNKPKKPPTAFFYFLEDFRKGYQEENPDVKSMRDIGKACGEKWKTMAYEERLQYYEIATVKRADFDNAMAEYIRRKESGEDEVSGDESEFDE